MTTATAAQIVLRLADPGDQGALLRLAALDSSRPPSPPVLVAEADGVLRAAVSLRDGAAIADPFYRSARLVTLLRTHAEAPAAVTPRTRRRRLQPGLAH
jgi:hypothetical protein